MISYITLDMNVLRLDNMLLVLSAGAVFGLVMSFVFAYTHRKTVYDNAFRMTLILLPVVISVIIMLVSNNLARAFSLAGVFTLVRFRTAIADSRDIAYILSTVGIGLATALGYIGYALIITAFISAVLLSLNAFQLDQVKTSHAKLRIIVPEDLNYFNAFDDIFSEYLDHYQLQRVKTTDFGSLFELTYLVKIKKGIDQKKMIDAIRVRNGNLNITLSSDYVSLMSE
ncbi:MAG: DUF4956 domain-containing protein [Acholeplasmataceae bacterium]